MTTDHRKTRSVTRAVTVGLAATAAAFLAHETACGASSVRASVRLSRQDAFPILTFHRIVGERSRLGLWGDTHLHLFRAYMECLARKGLRGVSLADAWDARDRETNRGARGLVALTFDDGYPETLDLAAPELLRLGFGATLFVPTRVVGRRPGFLAAFPDRPHWPRLMDWDDIREWAAHGLEVGSHTRTHPFLDDLADEDEEAAREELAGSRADIEAELGHSPRFLCYPYGGCSERVRELARETGYEAAATTTPPDGRVEPFALRRRDDFWGYAAPGAGHLLRRARFSVSHPRAHPWGS